MRRQVLFVDDEPLILEGLKRMLRGLRDEWDMHFVDSGENALALMGKRGIDVVVSDMRMPGMNGAELLNRVMEKHPQTVRLILSGYADRDLILGCLRSTHQYLCKPCDPETLLSAVRRAAEWEASLGSERLRRLIGQMQAVPSLPSLYGEIVDQTNDPHITLSEIATTISKDIAMTAKILKLVNSAFFGLGREVSSLHEAISYLGIETIKSLVLTVNAFTQLEKGDQRVIPMEAIWSHSLAVGAGAKQIAEAEECSSMVREQCFAAGMLHDIGKLVLAVNFPKEYASIVRSCAQSSKSLLEEERAQLGADHAEVGGALLGLWGLPGAIVDAIALHHTPSSTPIKRFTPLTAVYAANALTHDPKGRLLFHTSDSYLETIGLKDRTQEWKRVFPSSNPEKSADFAALTA